MRVTSIVYPGSRFGSPHHFLLWARGETPLTSRLFSPVLVNARNGELTAVARMPWYLRALEVSRPLHFGDYGGLPLKILWTLLDLVTIVVLGSGLYLWIARRRRTQARIDGLARRYAAVTRKELAA
ncbi:MAG: PepSY-associated TM helix domain-containing protein [Solimonas sp.]